MRLEDGKELYTISEAAAVFGVDRQTVYDWMRRRGLQWVWLGARRRITRQELLAFIRPGDMPAKQEYTSRNENTRSLVAV